MNRPPITVECAGVMARAKRRADYARVWVDFDASQWFTADEDDLTPGIQVDRSGKLRFAVASGSTLAQYAWQKIWYHLHGGLTTDQSIYGVSFDWRSSGALTFGVYEVDVPYRGAAWAGLGSAGGATQATPVSQNYTCSAGKHGLMILVCYNNAHTATSDEFIEFSELRVYGQDGDPSIGDALTDILVAPGLADSFYSRSVG